MIFRNRNNGKDNNGKDNNSNREVYVILFVFLFVFILMTVYLAVFQYRDGHKVINSSYNKRLDILANHVTRGDILANDGTVLATTVTDSEGNESRVYPYASLFAHSVGYSNYGGLGLESAYAYTLLTSDDNVLKIIKNDFSGVKNQGDTIKTTLDPMLTYYADIALGNNKGAVVVSNVKTGEILAIVSNPDFDPNYITDYWEYYNNEDTSVLLNRATQGLYPPGSTFKIVTALEKIREGGTEDYSYVCNGSFNINDYVINCYHGQSHKEVDFKTSFAKSCNSSFANITSDLNKTKFKKTCEDLLFNTSLPVPYSYKKSSVNINSQTGIEELLQTGIGQGTTQMTPMHVNMITSAIANEGILMTPYVVSEVYNSEGAVIETTKPTEYRRLMTISESNTLTELMEAVVEEGTATKLRGSSLYTAAGKTGSAEYSKNKKESHAWFTGFAPVENPEIAVTVIVEGGGSGGETAVPIAKVLFDEYFSR